jgi:hypothetical protein
MVPRSMGSGLLRANNKHYQDLQIFEVGSINMELVPPASGNS